MRKILLCLLITASVLSCSGCVAVVKKTNAPDADRKSDTATLKESTQDTVIEMED